VFPEPVSGLVQRVRRATKSLLKQATRSFIVCVTHGYSVQIMTELLSVSETVTDASYCCISKGFKKLSREEILYLEDKAAGRKRDQTNSPSADSDDDNGSGNYSSDGGGRPRKHSQHQAFRSLTKAPPFLENWTLLANTVTQHYIQLEPTKDVLAAFDRFLAPIHKKY